MVSLYLRRNLLIILIQFPWNISVGLAKNKLSFAEEYDSPPHIHEFSIYDTKLSDGEALVLNLWGDVEYIFIAITPRSTLTQSGSIC